MIVILVAAGFIVPVSVRIGRLVPYNDTSVFDVFFPFWFFIEIFSYRSSVALQMWLLVGTALLIFGLNVPAMVRAVREVLSGPHRSSSRTYASAATSREFASDAEGASR